MAQGSQANMEIEKIHFQSEGMKVIGNLFKQGNMQSTLVQQVI
jgi:hypothetical protein